MARLGLAVAVLLGFWLQTVFLPAQTTAPSGNVIAAFCGHAPSVPGNPDTPLHDCAHCPFCAVVAVFGPAPLPPSLTATRRVAPARFAAAATAPQTESPAASYRSRAPPSLKG